MSVDAQSPIAEKNTSDHSPGLPLRIGMMAVVVVLSLAHWVVLVFQIPVFTRMAWWFWGFHDNPLPKAWLYYPIVLALALGVAWAIHRWPNRRAINIALIIGLGVATQYCFALMSGHGVSSVRNRMIHSGHGEFAIVSVAEDNALWVLTNYEDLLDEGRLGVFCMTKPPGQLGFYMLTERTSRLFAGLINAPDDMTRLITFGMLTWTVLAALAALPLYLISARLFSGATAFLPPLFFVTMPGFCLILMHLDQVLYPLLFMTTIWLWNHAMHDGSWVAALLAGCITFLSIYVSFSLLVLFPALLLLTGVHLIVNRPLTPKLKKISLLALVFGAGYGVFHGLADTFLNFEIIERYERAMQFHATWKHTIVRLADKIHLFKLAYLDHFSWAAFALALLFLVAVTVSLTAVALRRATEIHLTVIATFGLFLIVGLFGHAKGETARLWIFLSPLFCLCATAAIAKWPSKSRGWLVALLMILQVTTTLLIRRYQDFY